MEHRNLKILAGQSSSGIKDEFGGMLSQRDLDVPDPLWQLLKEWNEEYIKVVRNNPMITGEEENIFRELDHRGVELCRKFTKFLGSETKIKYYSDGMSKNIYYAPK